MCDTPALPRGRRIGASQRAGGATWGLRRAGGRGYEHAHRRSWFSSEEWGMGTPSHRPRRVITWRYGRGGAACSTALLSPDGVGPWGRATLLLVEPAHD